MARAQDYGVNDYDPQGWSDPNGEGYSAQVVARKNALITWSFVPQEPESGHVGFDVQVFTGTSAAAADGRMGFLAVRDVDIREALIKFTPPTNAATPVMAAVRAVYTGAVGPWVSSGSGTAAGTAQAIPLATTTQLATVSQAATDAATAAQTAQQIAEGKNKTFVQTEAPTGTLTVGDLWFDSDDGNKSYRWSGSAWVVVQDSGAARGASSNKTYFQTAAPTSGMVVGDLWFDSDDSNKPYRYSGSAWVSAQDGSIAVLNSTKTTTYVQPAAPTGTLTAGDLWFDSDDGNKLYRWSGSAWVAVQDAGASRGAGTNKTFVQADAPISGMIAGDLWFDSDAGNVPYRYSGTAWASVSDGSKASTDLHDALDDAITSRLLAPGSVLLGTHVVVADADNLIPNGTSEAYNQSTTGFDATAIEAAAVFDTGGTGGYGSTRYCRAVSYAAGYFPVSPFIPCAPGDAFTFSGMVLNALDIPEAAGSACLAIQFYTTAKAAITGTGGRVIASTASEAWTALSVSAAAPASTGYVRFMIASLDANNESTARFDNLLARRRGNADFMVDGAITGRTIEGDALKTSNYWESSGIPQAGAKLDKIGTALKVVAGGMQVGSRIFTEYWWNLINAIDGGSGVGYLIVKGNDDPSIRGGAPDPGVLRIQARGGMRGADQAIVRYTAWLNVAETPGTYNLDTLTHLMIDYYQYTTSSSPAAYWRQIIQPRGYGGQTSFETDFLVMVPLGLTYAASPYQCSYYIRVALLNKYGTSARRDFGPTNTYWGDLPAATITGQTAPPPSGGGDTGGGGYCPAPWMKVTLASGEKVEGARLRNGAQVMGVNDATLEPAVGEVADLQVIWATRWAVELLDGRVPEWSERHRVFVARERGAELVQVQHLCPGDVLLGPVPNKVKAVRRSGRGQVVSFRVLRTGTYFADDVLCHNMKPVG